jgi:CelD/BcsL family acetyltransferase involved in cellulose biosynthesis
MMTATPIEVARRGVLSLDTEEVCGAAGLETLGPEWRRLFEASRAAPFLSWEWISAWREHFGGGRTPRVLCIRSAGRLVGLLPCASEQRRPGGLLGSVRRLSFLGESFGAPDYLDVLAIADQERPVAEAAIGHLAQSHAFDLPEFSSLTAGSAALPLLAHAFGDDSDFRLRIRPQFVCPRVKLPADWATLLRHSQRSAYFHRSLRRLEKVRGFTFRAVTDPAEAGEAFDRFWNLHEAAWAPRGGSGAAGSQAFLRDVAVRLARAGLVRFEELWADGDCRASIYGLESGGRYYFYLSGYDQAWSKYSVGYTVLGLSLQSAVERGLQYYDFLRGTEDYKFYWANDTRATVAVQVLNRSSFPARLVFAFGHMDAATRELLPRSVRLLVRRLRNRPAARRDGPSTTPAPANRGRTLERPPAAGAAETIHMRGRSTVL